MQAQFQQAGLTVPHRFLCETPMADAEAVRKLLFADRVEHRTVRAGQEPAQRRLLLPARLPPGKQSVPEDQSLGAEQAQVRPAALHEVVIAERADFLVVEQEQHGIRGQQIEHQAGVTLGEVAAGTVVRRPVGPQGLRHHASAGQRRRAQLKPRRRRRRPAIQQPLGAQRQPDRGDAVADQRIGAKDGEVAGIEIEPEQEHQQDTVAKQHQCAAPAGHAVLPRNPPTAQ